MTVRGIVGDGAPRKLNASGYLRVRRFLYPIKLYIIALVKNLIILAGFKKAMLTRMIEIVKERDSISEIADYKVLAKEETLEFNDEYDRKYLRRSPLFSDCAYRSKEIFVCSINNARFDMKTGAICARDNSLLAESTMEAGRLMFSSAYKSFVPKARPLRGTYATVWGLWGNQFYHWWIDCLPRTFSLSRMGLDEGVELLMPHNLKPYQKESLKYCLPENMKIKYLEDDGWVQVESLIFPSFVTWKACGFIPKPHLSHVRERIFKAFGITESPGRKNRIYLSRKNIYRRRVLNEPEVVEFLSDFGFKSYCPEDLTLEEQVRLFYDAEIVVAPHGSALVNLLFSGNIKVLEVFPISVPETHFFFLTRSLGQKYYYQFHDRGSLHDHFEIDMKEFKKAFSYMMND